MFRIKYLIQNILYSEYHILCKIYCLYKYHHDILRNVFAEINAEFHACINLNNIFRIKYFHTLNNIAGAFKNLWLTYF